MTMSRQLINLAGGLAALVILALGIVLVALPMFGQARATDQQADEIAQTNDVYQIQVQTLRAQEADLPALEQQLGDLRAQIPATSLNDQVYELIGRAAEDTGVEVESVAATAPETWTAPTAPSTDGSTTETPPVTPSTEAPPAETPTTETTDGAAVPDAAAATEATDGAGGETEGTATGTETPAAEVDPQQAVPITITVTAEDATQAARFIDAVRGATRLLSIEHAVLTEEEDGFRLVVNARSLLLAQK